MRKSYSEYQAEITKLEEEIVEMQEVLAGLHKFADIAKKEESEKKARKIAESKAKIVNQKRDIVERALFDYYIAIGFPNSEETKRGIHESLINSEKEIKHQLDIIYKAIKKES